MTDIAGGPAAVPSSDTKTQPRSSDRRRSSSADAKVSIRSDRPALYLTLAVVALVPLPLGSVETIWVALWSLLLALALVLMPIPPLRPMHKAVLGMVAGLGFLYAAAISLQLVNQPLVSNELWSETAGALQADPGRRSVTVNAEGSILALGHPLLLLMTFLAVLILSVSATNALLILKAIAYSGLFYALYGVLMLLFSPETLLWIKKPGYLANLTGTFINRNTAATYFGSCSIIWLVLLLSQIRQRLPDEKMTLSDAIVLLSNPTPFGALFAAGGFLVCFAAVLMTASRAGSVFTILCLLPVAAIYLTRRLSNVVSRRWLIIGGGAIALLFIQLLGSGLDQRLASGIAEDERWKAYDSILEMIRHHPWFGTGAGTFEDVFPAYRGADISYRGLWNMAHSTPLEIAVEMGVPIAALVALVWLAGLVLLLRGAVVRRRDMAFPLVGLGVGLLGSLHSCVDFSLQIPGYSVPFVAAVACGLAQSGRTRA